MLIRVVGASGDGDCALVALGLSNGTICTALLVKLIDGSSGSDSGSGELSPIFGVVAFFGAGGQCDGSKGFVLGKSCNGFRIGG